MAGKRKYRAQPLQVVCTDEMRAKIDEIAANEELSAAQVVREALDGAGLEARYAEHLRRMATKPKSAAV
jgi:hypothetical protein